MTDTPTPANTSDESLLERRWFKWVVYFLIWTAVGFFFASYSPLWGRQVFKAPVSWDEALITNLTFYYIWACIAPLVLWLGRRFRFERATWFSSFLVHIPTSVVVSAAQLFIAEIVSQSLSPEPLKLYDAFKEIQRTVTMYFHMNLLTYWAVLGVGYGREYYRKFRDREVRAVQLQAQLTQAQLQALKMQLHPHFLFNTFNTISSLMHRSVDEADRVLAVLGDLLRYSLQNVGVQEVTLSEELEFLKQYLEIEHARFGNRLRVKFDIDPEVLDEKLPNLILQPLVENSIRYAVAPRANGGSIGIFVRREGCTLQIKIVDDGPGLPAGFTLQTSKGIGLRNSASRMEQLYGKEQKFELVNQSPNGLQITIVLPLRPLFPPNTSSEETFSS
ncbi:MAG: histidine kinase [Ignavibacteriales bacterium]|nr:histidine kinase [Ignavibacteriales bacterium]